MKRIIIHVAAFMTAVVVQAEPVVLIDGVAQTLTDGVYALTADAAIDSFVITNATLDLNGHNCTAKDVSISVDDNAMTTILNSQNNTPVFTAAPSANTCSRYNGQFAGNFVFRKIGADGIARISSPSLNNAKISVDEGRLDLANDKVTGNLFRLIVDETRDTNTVGKMEWQVSEVVFIKDGVDLLWPEGTTAIGAYSWNFNNTSDCGKLVDNNPDKASAVNERWDRWITISTPHVISFDSYSLVMGGHHAGLINRDPLAWRIQKGTVGTNGKTNWTEIVSQRVTTEEYPASTAQIIRLRESFPIKEDVLSLQLPEAYELNVAANAELTIEKLGCDLNETRKVTGAGNVVLAGLTKGSLWTGGDFTGSVMAIGGIQDADEPKSVTVNGGSLEISGTDNTYSGTTVIGENGRFMTAGAVRAKYLRFKVSKTTMNGGMLNYRYAKLSEIEIFKNSEKLDWQQLNAVVEVEQLTDGYAKENVIDGKVDGDVEWRLDGAIVIKFPNPISFDGYSLYAATRGIYGTLSGNNWVTYNPHMCHPVSWTLEFSKDGSNWTEFDNVTDNWTLVNKNDGSAVNLVAAINVFTPGASYSTSSAEYLNMPLNSLLANCYRAKFYSHGMRAEGNVLSPNSALNIDGTCTIATAEERVPAITGAGRVELGTNTRLVLTNQRGEFNGTITGGELVLKGGTLSGTAMADGGDLTLTAAGGVYDATITDIAKLTLKQEGDNTFLIKNNAVSDPIHKTLFAFTSLGEGTAEVYNLAELFPAASGAWKFTLESDLDSEEKTFGYSLVKGGMVIIIR